jgi:nickel-dependent lactate racemase
MESLIYARLDAAQLEQAVEQWLATLPYPLQKVLIIPPDGTRAHSLAGPLTNILYRKLRAAEIRILPALGTHTPMTLVEKQRLFGFEIPEEAYLDHNWRSDVEYVGEIPPQLIAEVSEGLLNYSISVEINKEILHGGYDLIISVGQVVPHEVVGMANYTKNIVVGCGGKDIIDKSHFLGAVYGMERLMGRDHSPVRKVFDYAESKLLVDLPLVYLLTVTKTKGDVTSLEGLFIGNKREVFEKAVEKSQNCNLDLLERPLNKVVVYLDPREFRSTWVGNKAIYRTRMAIADGGDLIILAPGVNKFGEDPEIDLLIQSYGYCGKERILELVNSSVELRANLSVAAHLIHGSSNGRFNVTYAVEQLSREQIRAVGFEYMNYAEALAIYDPARLKDGMNWVNGEEIFFISNPALGLWALQEDFVQEAWR